MTESKEKLQHELEELKRIKRIEMNKRYYQRTRDEGTRKPRKVYETMLCPICCNGKQIKIDKFINHSRTKNHQRCMLLSCSLEEFETLKQKTSLQDFELEIISSLKKSNMN